MKRKVIQIAESTQLISLPRKWALANKILKGDELEVVPHSNKLVVSIDKEVEGDKTTINLKNDEFMAKRYLISAYRGGYDEVELIFKNSGLIREIQDTINSMLIGFEIISHSANRCVIKNISSSLDTEFDNILRRTFIITLAMGDNSYQAILQKDLTKVADSFATEVTNDKFTLFCQRLLNKKGYESYKKTTYLFLVTYQLEKIADEYKFLGNYLVRNKVKKISEDTLAIYKSVNAYLRRYYEVFYKYDSQVAGSMYKERKLITERIEAGFKKSHVNEHTVLHHLLDIVQLTTNMLGCQIGMVI